MSAELHCSQRRGDGGHIVILASEQSLAAAEACRRDLTGALDGRCVLTFDAYGTMAASSTFFRVLTSFRRYAKTCRVGLRWASRPMPCLRQAAEQLGFASGLASDHHFWRACPA